MKVSAIAILGLVTFAASSHGLKTWNLTVQPNWTPPLGNMMLCTSIRVPANESWTVVHFDFLDARPAAHPHFVLCPEPGFDGGQQQDEPAIWDCGEDSSQTLYPRAPYCADGVDRIGIATGVSGARLTFPPRAGFHAGGDTGMHAIVLGTHYPHTVREYVDNKTFVLTLAQPEEGEEALGEAYTMSLHTFARVPPSTLASVESVYVVQQEVHVHPFAFLAHCHAVGCRVTAWVVSPDGEWSTIGVFVKEGTDGHSIDMSVTYRPVAHPERVIVKGDRIAYQCSLPNASNRSLLVRATGDGQEMCGLGFTYFTRDGRKLDTDMVNFDHLEDGDRVSDWLTDPVLRSRHQPARQLPLHLTERL